ACLEPPLEIAAVKKLAVQQAGVVAHQQVVDRVPPAPEPHQATAHYLGLEGVRAAGLGLLDGGEADAVLVTERQVPHPIVARVDAAFGQQRRSLRSHSFQVLDFHLKRRRHDTRWFWPPRFLYIYHRRSARRRALQDFAPDLGSNPKEPGTAARVHAPPASAYLRPVPACG